MKNLKIFFLLAIILIGCDNNIDTKSLSTQQLLIFRTNIDKKFSNDSIEKLINFSINNVTDKYIYFLIDSINYDKKIISHKIKQQERTLLLEKKYRRNSFDICIKSKDTVFVDDLFSYSNSYSILFYNNHIIRDVDPPDVTYLDTIRDWNTINTCYTKVYIGMNLNKTEKFHKTEMKIFFNSVDTIIDFYGKLRDTISYKKFDRGFNNLTFSEQVSVIREKPLLIILDFEQCECYGYLKPPNLNFD